MAFARLNGVVCRVAADEGDRGLAMVGAVERSLAGNAVDGRRQARRTYRLRLANLPHEEARGLALLAMGYLHRLGFDGGLHAGTSLAPSGAHDAHLSPSGGWDGGAMVVRFGGSVVYPAQLQSEWTLLMRFKDETTAGVPWRMCALTSDGGEWLDGVAGTFGATNLLSVDGAGAVTVRGRDLSGAVSNLTVDELMICPFRMADAHVLDALAWEQPWGSSPELHLQGDAVDAPLGVFCTGVAPTGDVTARGRLASSYAPDAGWLNNSLAEEVELVETWRPDGLDRLPLPLLYVPHGSAFVSGLTVRERIGGLNLTDPAGAPSFAAGPDGLPSSATVYLGTSDDRAFRVGTEGSAVGAAARLTVAGWVRPTALTLQTLWSRWAEIGVQREWRVRDDGTGRVVVEVSDGGGANRETYSTNQPVLSAGAWHFVSFDYDAARPALTRVRAFVDGRPYILDAAAVGAFTGMTSSTGTLHVPGQRTPATGLSGQIAQWACWSTALTTTQQRIAYLLTKRGHPLRRA